ncbi:MAG: hypothetical protein ACP5HM_09320 [Anaerolineae bacterium]
MRGQPTLTSRQRRVLLGLGAALFLVLAAMGWSIWTTLRAMPTISVIPTPTQAPTQTPAPVETSVPTFTPTPLFKPARAGEIAQQVAAARELLPRWETPLTFVNTYDLSVILYHSYQETPPFPLSAQRTLAVLDLWPTADVEPDPVTQAETVAALYLPAQRQLYIRRDWSDAFRKLEAQLAYGYARTLSEQYGGLARLRSEATSIDEALALDAVALGDALVAFWRYADVEPGSPGAEALQGLLEPAIFPLWRTDVPELETLTRLPLKLGHDFALTRYEAEGLSGLNAVLRAPPRSTAQLVHPLEYERHADFTALDPLTPTLDATWVLTHTERVGQVLMRLAFESWAGKTLTPSVEGWDGDLLQVWAGPEGAEVVLWQTAWDSSRLAVDVEAQAEALLPRLLPGYVRETQRPQGLPPGRWWEGSRGVAFLYRYLDRVWLLWGDDEQAVQTIAASLLERGDAP